MSESRQRFIRQLSSSIFSSDFLHQDPIIRPIKKLSRDLSDASPAYGRPRTQTPTSSSLRPLDHPVADLFGNFPTQFYRKDIKGIYTTSVIKPIKRKEANNDKIHNRQSLDFSSGLLQNQCKQKYEVQEVVNIPKYNRSGKKGTERAESADIKIECIGIAGLNPNDDENTIKNLCKGMHIIQINTETDNLTGKCSGKAMLQVRSRNDSCDFEDLKAKLMRKGFEISSVTSAKGKRNTYQSTAGVNFLDAQLQREEKRLTTNSLSSNERKRAILGTSDDLFGNSPGTGRWNSIQICDLGFKENRQTRENLRQWELVKCTTSRSPLQVTNQSYSYSRPTISSSNKNLVNK